MAGPGVIIGTILVGLFAKYVFPYEWCWPKALLFGAMLSATDPVAVVALLKEVRIQILGPTDRDTLWVP